MSVSAWPHWRENHKQLIAALIFDLDGVVRHFDNAHRVEVERRHGLEPDSLWHNAFSPPHIDQLLTGQMTRAAWVQAVGDAIGNRQAAAEWLSAPASVDEEMRRLLVELQDIGHRKPKPEVYHHVGDHLGLDPHQIWFTDDSSTNVDSALAVGWQAEQFTSPQATRLSLATHDILS